jgi:hypothetical protein
MYRGFSKHRAAELGEGEAPTNTHPITGGRRSFHGASRYLCDSHHPWIG